MSTLKIMTTDPSSALRNAAEVKDILTHCYQGKQNIPLIIILYTDAGPEHRSNFPSVKIALIALQKSLNADMLVAVAFIQKPCRKSKLHFEYRIIWHWCNETNNNRRSFF